MKSEASVPRATYRLQLHRDFGFRQAAGAVPYLAALGISHVYCSPLLRATPGSMHGYDVVDPTALNPELGDAGDFDHFHRTVRAHGLALLLDIVPNHMGVESAANAWWQDLLANGAASPYASCFDIDWSGAGGVPPGRLLLPILGRPLAEAVAEGELRLQVEGTGFRLHYFDRSFPVNARGAALILQSAARRDEADGRDGGQVGDATPAAGFDSVLADPALVTAVADCQHYLLCPWQEAGVRINYRRFFDVAGLAALRIEDPAVFQASHRLVIELVRAGIVDALRIDHPDGLRDPGRYFERLQAAVAAAGGERPAAPIYLVAEKILAEGEDLPAEWPVNGTTGYDFANLVCGVLLDSEAVGEIDRIWRDFTGETAADFRAMAIEAKLEVMAASFGGELRSLARGFAAVSPQPTRPEDLETIAATLAEVIACFPVYRTYPGPAASAAARGYVREACEMARRRLDERAGGNDARHHHGWIEALEAILTGPVGDLGGDIAGGDPAIAARAAWAIRFQQLCAPVMAKGVEDTALYRWTRLLSVNDVGADPDVTGVTVDHFHAANGHRLEGWPHAMLGSSTHDSKRGEYARMRINALTEDPARWREIAQAWRDEAERLIGDAGTQRRPSAHDLYLLFQTFVGTWPVSLAAAPPAGAERQPAPAIPDPSYADRITAYMTKACREAKRDTSWVKPDEDYEASIHRLATRMVSDPDCAARMGRDVAPFAWYGALAALTLTVLKLTAPGVPDIYQGASILDDSLVDPDNRRPVDFEQRKAIADEFSRLVEGPADALRRTVVSWLASGDFDRAKLWIIHRLLGWRARHPAVFQEGDYVPVSLSGAAAPYRIAFTRRAGRHGILVLATRLYRRSGFPGQAESHGPRAPADLGIDLEAAGVPQAGLVDLLTGATPPAAVGPAQWLASRPLAVLAFESDPVSTDSKPSRDGRKT